MVGTWLEKTFPKKRNTDKAGAIFTALQYTRHFLIGPNIKDLIITSRGF